MNSGFMGMSQIYLGICLGIQRSKGIEYIYIYLKWCYTPKRSQMVGFLGDLFSDNPAYDVGILVYIWMKAD